MGPEVMEATLYVLNNTNLNLEFIKAEAGLSAWKKYGNPLHQETINTIVNPNACLKGPTQTPPGPGTFRSPTVILRQMLELYANVRPFKSRKGVPSIHNNVDMVIIRENTEGLYTGLEYIIGDAAMAIRNISKRASERIARFAFNFARREGRKKVTIVHKANVLKETCGLFRGICLEISKEYPDVLCEEMLVDTAAMKIAMIPQIFDVIVTTNLFGDILSDEAAQIGGSLGMAPGANIGDNYGLFEPIHGSAPSIAGKRIANPISMILAAKMMLEWLGEKSGANIIERAVIKTLSEGKKLTQDLGGNSTTDEIAEEIAKNILKV
ncbi:MAG: isocitrate/isopropylmalate dehydrogenase family protein [Candidatus Methanomethyliaceae archaeon]|nr:isocitrate/isopropylmalate dehydrogenase family protein [Candidatus Methanomethyliaceae archaeon]